MPAKCEPHRHVGREFSDTNRNETTQRKNRREVAIQKKSFWFEFRIVAVSEMPDTIAPTDLNVAFRLLIDGNGVTIWFTDSLALRKCAQKRTRSNGMRQCGIV